LKRVYTSDSGDNKIGVVDLKTMTVIKTLATDSKPDGTAYAKPFHKLYVSHERKGGSRVDVEKDEIIKTLKFDSETGMPQYDARSPKIYVNLQDQNIFAVIDPASETVVGGYPVGRCQGNHGMTLDVEHRRAFLACENNHLLTVFDLDTNRPIEFLELPGVVDVVKYDPGLKRIYAACSKRVHRGHSITIASWRISRCRSEFTALPLTRKHMESERRNRRKTGRRFRGRSSTKR
jgi:YVTN family beta-propeller protein